MSVSSSTLLNSQKFFIGKRFSVPQLIGAATVVAAIFAAALFAWQNPEESFEIVEPIYNQEKTISYSFTVTNNSNGLLKSSELYVYAPVQQLSSQRCCNAIESSHPYELVTDSIGNQALKFVFEVLPPYSQQVLRVQSNVSLAEQPNPLSTEVASYLQSEPNIEVGHLKLRAKADSLLQDSEMETAQAIHDWVYRTIQKMAYTRDIKGALYAYEKRAGDSTESAFLFVALARASGIPARPMGGYVLPVSGVVRATDYHNWAEFYVEGIWRIADPHLGIFDSQYENYLATRVIASVNEGDFTAHRYWHSGDGLTVQMN